MKKILFVGQAPSKNTRGRGPFTGRSGLRLARLSGVGLDEMLSAHDFENLLDCWPGKAGKGDSFPLDEACSAARRLDLGDRPLVVLVGKQIAEAFESGSAEYFEQFFLNHVCSVGADVKYNPRRIAWQSPDLPSPTVLQSGASGGVAGFLEVEKVLTVVIPHPSGVNRWWNDPANEERARRFLTSLLPGPRTAWPPTSCP